MSTRTLSDPKVEQLGEKHGTVGPMVWIALLCEAGLQEKAGAVERSYRKIAHDVFSDAGTVSAVLDSAIDLGLCRAVSRDVHGFKIELPKWKTWQATGRKAKERAEKQSAEKPHQQADVTESHAESHDVPYKTRQDSTKKKKSPSSKNGAPLCHLLADLMVENGCKRPTVSKAWEVEEDRLLRLDGRDLEKAKNLLVWTQRSSFWRANVQSMPTFRAKYDTLRLQAIEEQEKRGGTVTKASTKDRSAYSKVEAAA